MFRKLAKLHEKGGLGLGEQQNISIVERKKRV
jgi:hypothetical protein